jgi:UDP-3-O-[3-hydroxymyristoyl] glucosamine N-acyltransferase
VIIGENCLIAAQSGIAGCTVVGNGVTILGQVGISKTLNIGDGVVLLSQSGVAHNLKAGETYLGTPAVPALQKSRELVWIKRIPEIWEKVKNLPVHFSQSDKESASK